MKLKEARKIMGLSQSATAALTGIPIKTLQHWEAFENNPESAGAREPGRGIKELVIQKILNDKPTFKIHNESVNNYAKICKEFAAQTADWGSLDDNRFYTTHGTTWAETPDNAHNGVSISWAFQLTEYEIEQRASEKLFEQVMNELDLADSDSWGAECFKIIYDKFNF